MVETALRPATTPILSMREAAERIRESKRLSVKGRMDASIEGNQYRVERLTDLQLIGKQMQKEKMLRLGAGFKIGARKESGETPFNWQGKFPNARQPEAPIGMRDRMIRLAVGTETLRRQASMKREDLAPTRLLQQAKRNRLLGTARNAFWGPRY
jgi:hypothetical protein